jgi:hypothetical protein
MASAMVSARKKERNDFFSMDKHRHLIVCNIYIYIHISTQGANTLQLPGEKAMRVEKETRPEPTIQYITARFCQLSAYEIQ